MKGSPPLKTLHYFQSFRYQTPLLTVHSKPSGFLVTLGSSEKMMPYLFQVQSLGLTGMLATADLQMI